MDRFCFIRNADESFKPECTGLLKGNLSIDDVPDKGIQQILYFCLDMQIDCLRMRWELSDNSDAVSKIYQDYLINLNLDKAWILNMDKTHQDYMAMLPMSGIKLHIDVAADGMAQWCKQLDWLIAAGMVTEKIREVILAGLEEKIEDQEDHVELLVNLLTRC